MKIFYLRSKEILYPGRRRCNGQIIQAENELEARAWAASNAEGEGIDTWLNPEYSTCTELPDSGPSHPIMLDIKY